MDRADMIVQGIEMTAEAFGSQEIDYSGLPTMQRVEQIVQDFASVVTLETPIPIYDHLEWCAIGYIMGGTNVTSAKDQSP